MSVYPLSPVLFRRKFAKTKDGTRVQQWLARNELNEEKTQQPFMSQSPPFQGLVNPSFTNLCHVNAAFQMLAQEPCGKIVNEVEKPLNDAFTKIQQIFGLLSQPRSWAIDISSYVKHFLPVGQQGDVHETYNQIIHIIHDALNGGIGDVACEELMKVVLYKTPNESVETMIKRVTRQYFKLKNNSKIYDYKSIMSCEELRCIKCHKVTVIPQQLLKLTIQLHFSNEIKLQYAFQDTKDIHIEFITVADRHLFYECDDEVQKQKERECWSFYLQQILQRVHKRQINQETFQIHGGKNNDVNRFVKYRTNDGKLYRYEMYLCQKQQANQLQFTGIREIDSISLLDAVMSNNVFVVFQPYMWQSPGLQRMINVSFLDGNSNSPILLPSKWMYSNLTERRLRDYIQKHVFPEFGYVIKYSHIDENQITSIQLSQVSRNIQIKSILVEISKCVSMNVQITPFEAIFQYRANSYHQSQDYVKFKLCDSCESNEYHYSKLQLYTCPSFITMSINRNGYNPMNFVTFKIMSAFVLPNFNNWQIPVLFASGEVNYQIEYLTVQDGIAAVGHIYVYKLDLEKNQWFKCDDAKIEAINNMSEEYFANKVCENVVSIGCRKMN